MIILGKNELALWIAFMKVTGVGISKSQWLSFPQLILPHCKLVEDISTLFSPVLPEHRSVPTRNLLYKCLVGYIIAVMMLIS